jgi:hypothetical protein
MSAPNPVTATSSDKLKALDQFLPEWDPTEGWPSTALLSVDERNAISSAFWEEQEITWLRVLGTVLNPSSEKNYLEVSVVNHFQFFPEDLDRMFAYWMRSRPLKEHGMALFQTYRAAFVGAPYPALTGVVPLAETVMKHEGYKKGFRLDYKKFFADHDATGGVGTRTAGTFVELLYEKDPVGGVDNRERFNRHVTLLSQSPP